MNQIRNNRGQGLLLFALGIGALMVVLIGTILFNLAHLDREVTALKIRVESYQATIQISQALQAAVDVGSRDSTCALAGAGGGGSSLVPLALHLAGTAAPTVICVPPGGICTGTAGATRTYCISQNDGAYNISKFEGLLPEQPFEVAEPTKSLWDSISLFPLAHAQSAGQKLLLNPPIPGGTNPTINNMACDTTLNSRCVICGDSATSTARCFSVRICTNNSSICADPGTYLMATIAVNYRKNP